MTKKIVTLLIVLALVAGNLVAQSAAGGRARATTPASYNLTVRSNVANATLLINDEQQRVTRYPHTVSLTEGTYTIVVRAQGYQDFRTTVNLTSNQTVTASLQSSAYTLRVNSNVREAEIFVNNQRKGTGTHQESLAAGTYNIRVTAQGYSDFTTTVNLNSNQTVTANLQQVTFNLRVNTNVRTATIYVDGDQMGTGSYAGSMPQGTYNVRVAAEGYEDFSTTVNLNSNQVVTANLRQAMSGVSLLFPSSMFAPGLNDPLGQIEVYIDGDRINNPNRIQTGSPPRQGFELQIRPGRRRVRIVSGAFVFETDFVFHPLRTYTIDPSFSLNVREQ
ncbi:MAG: PEGA domain-containing protein [Spirochaetaceae bacterium]|nr:MAG: PEGA domain-containing protein [Spirochaetaceae bacterium]